MSETGEQSKQYARERGRKPNTSAIIYLLKSTPGVTKRSVTLRLDVAQRASLEEKKRTKTRLLVF